VVNVYTTASSGDEMPNTSNFARLLLTPEEEEQIGRENNPNNYQYTFSDGSGSIQVVGTPHLYNLEGAIPITRALAGDVDHLLVEGKAALNIGDLVEPTADASFVLANYGEQSYAAWLAKQKGVEVASWDIDMLSLLIEAREYHSDRAIIGWLAGMGAKHIIDRREALDPQHLAELISSGLGYSYADFTNRLGLDLTSEAINTAVQFYVGRNFAELSYDDAEELATPRKTGETNAVIRDMNKRRDKMLLETVTRHKGQFNRTVVTCGKSHAITWKPALKEMYTNTNDEE